jgi:hypothetical protein
VQETGSKGNVRGGETEVMALPCYDGRMFRFGRPSTPAGWIGHAILAVIAIALVWWMLRVFVL